MNKRWIFLYEPVSKRQSAEWKVTESLVKKKKSVLSAANSKSHVDFILSHKGSHHLISRKKSATMNSGADC